MSIERDQQEPRYLQQDDDEICFVGIVMDTYCIDRGVLFDVSSANTLEQPNRHSIHCLVDVDRCVHSGYQMLLDEPNDDNKHCRAFVLDDRGTDLLIAQARETGKRGYCETCTGPTGSQSRGYRATVYGKIVDVDADAPLLLEVSRVAPATVGCGVDGSYVPSRVDCGSGSYLPFFATHGTLMLLSWGLLLPLGVLSARFLRHRSESALWYKIHRVLQPSGMLLALVGWVVALAGPFDVLGSGVHDASFAHAVMGTCVTVMGLFQPLNAYLRPHKPSNSEEASSALRKRWELTHKSVGYVCSAAGFVNCFLGMALSGKFSDQFFFALIVSTIALVIFIALSCFDKRRILSSVTRKDNVEDPNKDEIEEDKPLTDENNDYSGAS